MMLQQKNQDKNHLEILCFYLILEAASIEIVLKLYFFMSLTVKTDRPIFAASFSFCESRIFRDPALQTETHLSPLQSQPLKRCSTPLLCQRCQEALSEHKNSHYRGANMSDLVFDSDPPLL